MHELAIAQSIVALAEAQAWQHHASLVEEVELEIGRLSGVEIPTLEFALESAVKGSLLEKARIIRHYIDGEACCAECDTLYPLPTLLSPCPHCGSWYFRILKGKELRVKSIVIT